MYRRESRARRRRRKSRLPLYAFLLAVLSFVLAFALPPEEKKDLPVQTATVKPIAAVPDPEPVLPPDPEPVLPPEPGVPDKDAWNLILANPWNPLSEDYAFTQKALPNGLVVDERCYPDLQAMMDACRASGLSPVICSAYRSYEKQEELFRRKVDKLTARGYSAGDAQTEAAREVALPGTSEHQTGLAVDIVDLDNQNLDESQEDTAVQKWLMEHSWEYGFILRYPSGTSDLTGIIYEPWHYRYVGREAAQAIHDQGVCLEEYLAA
jgi:D-alanyl-D-alanine carboxypeptidase